jgi:hypothetical protein
MTLKPDGSYLLNGVRFVKTPGVSDGRLGTSAWSSAEKALTDAKFWVLEPNQTSSASPECMPGTPTAAVTWRTADGRQKTLNYRAGCGGPEGRALIPALKWQHDSWLFAAGLNYTGIEADFNTSANLGTTHLHDLAIQLVAAYNNPNTPWWALGFLTPGIASDFSSVTSDALTATSLALVGYRWNDHLDLAAGVFASWSLGEASVLPAIGFIWNPSSHWTIQATPPIVAIGWKPIPNWTFGLVAYPAGGSWEIGNSSDPTRQINLSLWRAALSIERRLGPHWRISARSGIAFAGDIEFRDSSARVLSSSNLDSAPFAALALKWAF